MKNKNFCEKCGTELKPGDSFCAACGCQIDVKQEQEVNIAQTSDKNQGGIKSAVSAVSKKDKRIFIVFGVFVLLVILISLIVIICVNSSDSDLIGTWKDSDDGDIVAVFADNGIMYWDDIIMHYEIVQNGVIKATDMCLLDEYPEGGIDEFLEYYAEDYINEHKKDRSDNEELLYYKLVKGEMYDKLYLEDGIKDLERCISKDRYSVRYNISD